MTQPLTGLGAGQGILVVPSGDTVSAYEHRTDTTAPTITVPGTTTVKATSMSGAAVTYTATASDPDDSSPTLSCVPVSGSTFPVGATTVNCTASDPAGNRSTASFLVVVNGPGADCNLGDYPIVKGAFNLKNANLSGCYLPGANLTAANATNANLIAAYLGGANLSKANLSQAHLQQSVLTDANLSNANLSRANLTGAKLTGATLTGVTWSQTTCPDGTSSNTDGGSCVGHL